MSTAWTLPAQAIIVDALEHMTALGQDETPSASDYDVCMKGLQGILKELPVHGFSWPQITVDPTALAWDALTPGEVAMPADYFGVPAVSYVVNGVQVPVRIVSKAEYDRLLQSIAVSPFPRVLCMYVAPDFTGNLWPVPIADPGLSMTYQAIVPDAAQTQVPRLPQTWTLFMGVWLAWELKTKFSVPAQRVAEIREQYQIKSALCLGYAAETAPIEFGVRD